MIDLSKNVELICVDGRDDISKIMLSAKALSYSCRGVYFSSVKLLSTFCPSTFVGEFIRIPSLNLREYNQFMIKELPKYVSAAHVLLVQWDGFVIKPHLWENKFLNYDFVGAPWPPEWPNRVGRVGNGGFSLRSKRIINFASSLDFSEDETEDNFLCLTNREFLESNGFNFAPPEIAAKFSWENPIPENTPDNTFGFHGRHLPIHREYIKLL